MAKGTPMESASALARGVFPEPEGPISRTLLFSMMTSLRPASLTIGACEPRSRAGGPLLSPYVQDYGGLGDAGPADGDGVFGIAARHEEADLRLGATAMVAAGRRILGIGGGGHDTFDHGG